MARAVRIARFRADFDTAIDVARNTLSSLGLTIEKDADGLIVSYRQLDQVVGRTTEQQVFLYVEIEIKDLNEKTSGLRVTCGVPTARSREISVQVEKTMALVWHTLGENVEIDEPKAVTINLPKSKNHRPRPLKLITIVLLSLGCVGAAWWLTKSQSFNFESKNKTPQKSRLADDQTQYMIYNHKAEYDPNLRLAPAVKKEYIVSLHFYGGDKSSCVLGLVGNASSDTQSLNTYFLLVIFDQTGHELHRETVDVDLSEVPAGSEYHFIFRAAGVTCSDVAEASIQDVGACSVDGTVRASCADIIVPAPSSDIRITKN